MGFRVGVWVVGNPYGSELGCKVARVPRTYTEREIHMDGDADHVQSQTHTCTDACAARHSYASLAMGHMSGHCALSSQLFQCCRNLPHLFYSHTHMPPSPPNDADVISNQMSSRLGHLKSTWMRRQVDSRWETKLARSKST